MGCIHSLEINENKVKPIVNSLNIGSPKSPINEDPISPGYYTPELSGHDKIDEFTKPNLRIRIPSENKQKVVKYTKNKYIDEDDVTESYTLFCNY